MFLVPIIPNAPLTPAASVKDGYRPPPEAARSVLYRSEDAAILAPIG